MSAVPLEFADLARRYDLKAEDIVWVETNVYGVLIGFKNGTSRTFDPPEPGPRSMNP